MGKDPGGLRTWNQWNDKQSKQLTTGATIETNWNHWKQVPWVPRKFQIGFHGKRSVFSKVPLVPVFPGGH